MPEIFLGIAIVALVVPAIYYWVYPHPKITKAKIGELTRSHNSRVEHIENEIELAKKHHSGGTRVYGGAEPWAEAERYELALRDKLSREVSEYEEKIEDMKRFPLTTALVIFSIFLTSIGMFLANLPKAQ
ncbi:MAG: hypothetical protein HY578_01455 [Nitrospinae bacterium]|nr:hypothetical protein [Nitrospinota bacterium]